MSKKEISVSMVKEIANEELKNYVDDKLNEENLRNTIREELNQTGKNFVLSNLGLRWNSWDRVYELNSYDKFESILRKQKSLIEDVGVKVICELIKEVTPVDVLSSLKEKDKISLRKVYRDTLMYYFKEKVKELAKKHGAEYAKGLFEQYINENQ
jgi:hypothetical protein